MGDASGIRAGKAYVELYGEDEGLDATLDKSDKKIKGWADRLGGAGRAVASTFGSTIAAVGSAAAVSATAAVSLAGAGLAALGFGKKIEHAATQTDLVVSALDRLRSVGAKSWDFLSTSVGRSAGAVGGLIRLVDILRKSTSEVGKDGSLKTSTADLASQLAASGQQTARAGQWKSFVMGDKEAHAFYTDARAIADGAAVAAAYSKSFVGGVATRLQIGLRRGLTGAADGLGHLANTLTLGTSGALVDVGKGVAGSLMGISSAAAHTGTRLGGLRDFFDSCVKGGSAFFATLHGKSALLGGVATGIVATLSAAAGFDLTTIGSRLMHNKNFAESAQGLHKRGNALVTRGDVSNALSLQNAMERFFQAAEAVWAQIGAAVAPIVRNSLNATADWVAGLAKWMQANRAMVKTLFNVASAVAKVAVGFAVVSRLVAFAGPLFAIISTPVGALTVLLLAGAAAWLWWSGNGSRAIKYLSALCKPFYETFKAAWEGIVSAVRSGDLALAGKIAFLGIELGFRQMLDTMGIRLSDFMRFVFRVARSFADVWAGVWAGMGKGWATTVGFIADKLIRLQALIEGWDANKLNNALKANAFDTNFNVAGADKDRDAAFKRNEALLEQRLAAMKNDADRIAELKAELAAAVLRAGQANGDRFKAVTLPDKHELAGVHQQAHLGTFNAAAVQGMLPSTTALDKIANNTQQANKLLDAINKKNAGKLAFVGGAGF